MCCSWADGDSDAGRGHKTHKRKSCPKSSRSCLRYKRPLPQAENTGFWHSKRPRHIETEDSVSILFHDKLMLTQRQGLQSVVARTPAAEESFWPGRSGPPGGPILVGQSLVVPLVEQLSSPNMDALDSQQPGFCSRPTRPQTAQRGAIASRSSPLRGIECRCSGTRLFPRIPPIDDGDRAKRTRRRMPFGGNASSEVLPPTLSF